jgi:GNAT superfamily N-acetyltransferase
MKDARTVNNRPGGSILGGDADKKAIGPPEPPRTLIQKFRNVMNRKPLSSDQIGVRPATLADVPQLCELLLFLFAREADFKPDAECQTRGLRLILEQPDVGCIYCAIAGESIIGMVSLLFTISTAEGGLAAWLEDMVVHPDWQKKGIGQLLLEEAINQARARGCCRLTLLTDSTNAPAIHFYERAGFLRSRMIPMRHYL